MVYLTDYCLTATTGRHGNVIPIELLQQAALKCGSGLRRREPLNFQTLVIYLVRASPGVSTNPALPNEIGFVL
jgi:hypothetical protein